MILIIGLVACVGIWYMGGFEDLRRHHEKVRKSRKSKE